MRFSINDLSNRFSELLMEAGHVQVRSDTLNNPLFPGEFNRCMEHGGVNNRLRGDLKAQPDRWYSIAPAIRTKDFYLAPKGTHATAFEVMCSLEYVSPDNVGRGLREVSALFLKFTKQVGIDINDLSLTLFGGGEILGKSFQQEPDWFDIWCELGVPKERISFIEGPKLYTLFLGQRERCGPRCEVSWEPRRGGNWSAIEIGTLIWDRELVTSTGGEVIFEPTVEHAVGMAIGCERIASVLSGGDLLSFHPLDAVLAAVRVEAGPIGEDLLEDARSLVDALKAAMFLEALCVGPLTAAQETFKEAIYARIARKTFILGIADGPNWPLSVCGTIATAYRARYADFDSAVQTVAKRVAVTDLLQAWNPRGYGGPPADAVGPN